MRAGGPELLAGWVEPQGQGEVRGPRLPWRGSAPTGPASPTTSAPPRFKESVQTLGHVDFFGRVHCVSPLLYETGRIPFTLSMDNGQSFPRSGTWLAGEPTLLAQALPPTMGTFPSAKLCTPGPPTGSCHSG